MNAPAPSRPLPQHVNTFVVGAGFAGVALAIKLDEAGERNYLVAERGDDVGGTWRDNTYPGAACDVPSQLYSYSFALNPTWSRSFSPQPEIQAYIQRVAQDAGVLDRFRFGVEVEEARWDDESLRWRIRTSAGELTADVVVSASGALSEPRLPDIDGIDSFGGEIFHSAQWDHDADLKGKRVAVIGTGASAIQIVPEIAKTAGHLDVYQRTAPWVIPRHDRAYTRAERLAFRHLPGVQRLYRTAIYWGRECYVPAFAFWPPLTLPAKLLATSNIAKHIPDPELRRKVTPNFRIGCKRILISNTYYPALVQDHVDLVTDPISKVTPTGIVTADGTEREVDVLVVATGFHTTDMPIAHQVVGRAGRTLAEEWAEDGVAAYKGATVHGFPNLFFLVGPNTGLGHSSMVFMIESQVAYVVDALATMRARDLVTVEPKRGEQDAWNADLQRRMKRTVWNTGGCSSWYLDEHGRNVTLWPRSTFAFRRLTQAFDPAAYHLVSENDAAATHAGRTGRTDIPAELQELHA
ncbi:flavin-containing monooxygenase [Nocardioides massiliensis]|uniref:Cyclohexanone monooxygenase n=1 Tax=Nocardioides massiliensis TaxID=1325935 RepID=A0ABT9NSG5_9ACTN|nr:NAD(P)/FAD-dependent oxidoreductase [Nocardioides massiliensis]MDP9823359.1 cyclohexanone monooxygenase [Nocardioides massiliensis]